MILIIALPTQGAGNVPNRTVVIDQIPILDYAIHVVAREHIQASRRMSGKSLWSHQIKVMYEDLNSYMTFFVAHDRIR